MSNRTPLAAAGPAASEAGARLLVAIAESGSEGGPAEYFAADGVWSGACGPDGAPVSDAAGLAIRVTDASEPVTGRIGTVTYSASFE